MAKKQSYFLYGMQGLGDNIYQRAIVREMVGDIWLETPWPQLYADLPIKCVKPNTKLRTQARNAARADSLWTHDKPSKPITQLRPHYVASKGTMLQGLLDACSLKRSSIVFDLPPLPQPAARAPYVVVRPATIRTEWRADSRNPLPEYIALAAQLLHDAGYHIISVADLVPNIEWAVEPLPPACEQFHHGELLVEDLLALVANAAAVVGGVGWLAPAAVAARVPMFLIYGGWGFHNGPQRIFDQRIDTSRIEQAIPTRFCLCQSRNHDCDRRIDQFDEQLKRWIVGLDQVQSSAMVAGVGDRVVSDSGATV